METTPRPVIDSVLRSVCGRPPQRLVRLTGGGLNEAYRVEMLDRLPVVVRIARRPTPWFTDEAQLMARARGVGVPTPEVLGVEHIEEDGQLLSFSVLQLIPGRSLDELAGRLPASDVERVVIDGGELMATVHSVAVERGIAHRLEPPDDELAGRAVRAADHALGPTGAATVERGIAVARDAAAAGPVVRSSLAHGDFLPKHLLIDDTMTITGVIDWEFAGPASPAFDLAHWEVAAGAGLHDRSHLVRRGYRRVADPDAADEGQVAPYAIGFAIDVLGWKNPASPDRIRRAVAVIADHIPG